MKMVSPQELLNDLLLQRGFTRPPVRTLRYSRKTDMEGPYHLRDVDRIIERHLESIADSARDQCGCLHNTIVTTSFDGDTVKTAAWITVRYE